VITIDVSAAQNSIPIEHLCKQWVDHKGMEDVVASGDARVRVGVIMTLGAPEFSSVRVEVSIEAPCKVAGPAMDQAAEALYDRALGLADSFVEPTYKGLVRHLEALHGDDHG